jgi:uncharacterized radical SAM protein YgiQ
MNKGLFSRRQYWAARFGVAPFLPMSREEMDELGWDSCDVILVTGDAYVDHPSFGMAIIGRLLESQGFRVGIIAQPDWRDAADFTTLGKPNLFFGVTAGNMDSMVNHYTSDRKIRRDDAYSPDGKAGKRPDRATIVYAQRCREVFADVPIVLGGIEASLRRLAHFDYWSDTVRRSILFDAKADILVYGNAERAIVDIAHRLGRRQAISDMQDLRGVAFAVAEPPADAVFLSSFDEVTADKKKYAKTARTYFYETNPHNAKTLVQRQGDRWLQVNPPPLPLTEKELDRVYELPYQRMPHPAYTGQKIPAYDMIKFSVNIMRGCFGGCTFCSITTHEGRIIQNRSEDSVLREIATIRDKTPGFHGEISDLGGPTANMYRLGCKDKQTESMCRKLSCIHPQICSNLQTSHKSLVRLYRQARKQEGIKSIRIASGVRYDLAVRDRDYVRELATHHVGGYLKVAPEHVASRPLRLMMKPEIDSFDTFKRMFEEYSAEAGKEQYLIPYFIAAHPGSTAEDMLELREWLKQRNFRPRQVQTFLPTPMALASAMYHSGYNPLKKQVSSELVFSARNLKDRQFQKACLLYYTPENRGLLDLYSTKREHT